MHAFSVSRLVQGAICAELRPHLEELADQLVDHLRQPGQRSTGFMPYADAGLVGALVTNAWGFPWSSPVIHWGARSSDGSSKQASIAMAGSTYAMTAASRRRNRC